MMLVAFLITLACLAWAVVTVVLALVHGTDTYDALRGVRPPFLYFFLCSLPAASLWPVFGPWKLYKYATSVNAVEFVKFHIKKAFTDLWS